MRTYDERLHAPLSLWVGVWVMSLVLGVSFLAALGPLPGLVAVAVPGAVMSAVLLRSAAVVRVEDGQLTAGPARIPVEALGTVRVLDAAQARHTRGPGSDPAAYHLIRGWVPAGVRADVVDPGDATPYWFVASRRPEQLAAAVEDARTGPPSED